MTSKMNYLATITYVTKFQDRPKMASKWPLRSILSSEQAQVASITYVTKFQGIFIRQKMTLWPGDDDKQGR